MTAIEIIRKYYPENNQLLSLLMTHSKSVAKKAIEIARNLNDPDIDFELLTEGAMLHDIGIFRCKAPGIFCYGERPYICHGIEGAEILRKEGLPRHALICERHTGSGLTAKEIEEANLPLPHRDMLPLSIEEKIICVADKFYSKGTDPKREKSLMQIASEMAMHGKEALNRWIALRDEILRN